MEKTASTTKLRSTSLLWLNQHVQEITCVCANRYKNMWSCFYVAKTVTWNGVDSTPPRHLPIEETFSQIKVIRLKTVCF